MWRRSSGFESHLRDARVRAAPGWRTSVPVRAMEETAGKVGVVAPTLGSGPEGRTAGREGSGFVVFDSIVVGLSPRFAATGVAAALDSFSKWSNENLRVLRSGSLALCLGSILVLTARSHLWRPIGTSTLLAPRAGEPTFSLLRRLTTRRRVLHGRVVGVGAGGELWFAHWPVLPRALIVREPVPVAEFDPERHIAVKIFGVDASSAESQAWLVANVVHSPLAVTVRLLGPIDPSASCTIPSPQPAPSSPFPAPPPSAPSSSSEPLSPLPSSSSSTSSSSSLLSSSSSSSSPSASSPSSSPSLTGDPVQPSRSSALTQGAHRLKTGGVAFLALVLQRSRWRDLAPRMVAERMLEANAARLAASADVILQHRGHCLQDGPPAGSAAAAASTDFSDVSWIGPDTLREAASAYARLGKAEDRRAPPPSAAGGWLRFLRRGRVGQ